MATVKSNSDNRYYNKLININQKNFLPIFTTSKFIVSQNYNNGSWIIVSEQSDFANTYQTITNVDGTQVITQGTFTVPAENAGKTVTKNYMHEIYLGGEHIAGGFGVASAQLRDNVTYVGNSYNATFSYHVNSRTKLSLTDVKTVSSYDENEILTYINSNTYAYTSSNNTILGIGLQYVASTNSYNIAFTDGNIYNYGLYWDNPTIEAREDGFLEEEDLVPDMMHEYNVLWDDFNYADAIEVKTICNSIVHYGVKSTDSNAVKVAGPLRRSYNNLKTSPYVFRYYYTIDELYDFFHNTQLNDVTKYNEVFNSFVNIFEGYALYDSENSTKNKLYFYKTFNNSTIRILLDLTNCFIEIDLNEYITDNIQNIYIDGMNINVFFIPRVYEAEDTSENDYTEDILNEYEYPIIFYYQYKPSDFSNQFESHVSDFDEYKTSVDATLQEYNNRIKQQEEEIAYLTNIIEEYINK